MHRRVEVAELSSRTRGRPEARDDMFGAGRAAPTGAGTRRRVHAVHSRGPEFRIFSDVHVIQPFLDTDGGGCSIDPGSEFRTSARVRNPSCPGRHRAG